MSSPDRTAYSSSLMRQSFHVDSDLAAILSPAVAAGKRGRMVSGTRLWLLNEVRAYMRCTRRRQQREACRRARQSGDRGAQGCAQV